MNAPMIINNIDNSEKSRTNLQLVASASHHETSRTIQNYLNPTNNNSKQLLMSSTLHNPNVISSDLTSKDELKQTVSASNNDRGENEIVHAS